MTDQKSLIQSIHPSLLHKRILIGAAIALFVIAYF